MSVNANSGGQFDLEAGSPVATQSLDQHRGSTGSALQTDDLTLQDGAERFEIGNDDASSNIPELSFMQAADLGEEGRHDFIESAFPSKIRARCIFDDPDGDELDFGLEDDEGQEPQSDTFDLPDVPHAAVAAKRRIVGKTAASETIGFPLQPQVTKAEQRRLKGIEKEKARKAAIAVNRAKARARNSILNDPGLAGSLEVDEAHGTEEVVDPFAPHPSHTLREMVSASVTYCNTCSHWAWHNKHSKLAKPC